MAGPLRSAGRQVEHAVENQARIGKASILRNASITRYIGSRWGEAQKEHINQKKGKALRERSGVYVQEGPAVIAPDGYARRSPVQELRVEPGYVKKRVRKAAGIVLLILLALGAAAILLRYIRI